MTLPLETTGFVDRWISMPDPDLGKIRVPGTKMKLDRDYVENKAAWYVLMKRCGDWLGRDLTLT